MRMTDAMISRMELDRSFIPPFPERPQTRLPFRETLRRASENILDIFTERDFINRQMRARVLGRDFFVCNNPAGVREAFGDHHAAFDRKTLYQKRALSPLIGDALLVSEGALWAGRHALVSPLLQGASPVWPVAQARAAIIEVCTRWHAAGAGARVDVLAEMGRFATQFTARLLFGETVGRRFGPSIARHVALFQNNIATLDLASLIGLPQVLPSRGGFAGRMAAARARLAVEEAIAALDDAPDAAPEGALVRQLLAARDGEGKPLSRAAVRNETLGLFVAGRETMAVTLAWALYLVSQSPRVAANVEAELTAVLGGRTPQLKDFARLTYTRAVLEETMRLYPPIPFLARRAGSRGSVNGMVAKRGSVLLVTPWLVHRNRSIWSLPDHFVPERFDEANSPLRDPFSSLAFSAGPRACPAQDLATTAMLTALATVLQTFVVEADPAHKVEIDAHILLRPGRHLPMFVRWRPATPPAADAPHADLAALEHAIVAAHATGAQAERVGKAGELKTALGRLPRRLGLASGAKVPAAGALAALERLAPDLAPAQRQALAKAWQRNEARAIADYERLPALIDPRRLQREGLSHLHAAQASGRGLVVTTIASAVDDLFAALVADDCGDDAMVLGAPELRGIDAATAARMRSLLALPVLPADALAATLVARAGLPGTVLALHLDAPGADGGVHFPLFGRPAPQDGPTALVLAAAHKDGALIVPATLRRGGRGRHILRYHAPLDPDSRTPADLLNALDALYEPFVRENLGQWRRLDLY